MFSPLHPHLSNFIDEHDDGVSAYLLTPTAPIATNHSLTKYYKLLTKNN